MKKLIPAAALSLTLAGGASGQDAAPTVSVFGIMDAGVTIQSHRAPSGTAEGVASGPWQASRVGVAGGLDLGGDLKAVYNAATTLGINAGSQLNASRIFDRNAFVGASSGRYGTILIGRQPTAVAETLWIVDPLRANNGATNMNVRFGYLAAPGKTLYSSFGPNAASNTNGSGLDRQDNSVKYVFKNGGLLAAAMYSFGGVAGAASASSSAGGALGYEGGPVNLRAAIHEYKDPNHVSFLAYTVGAVVDLKPVKLRATFSQNKVNDAAVYGNLDTRVWAAGATLSATSNVDVTLAYYDGNRSQLGTPTEKARKVYLVPEWFVRRNLWLYAIVDYEMFNDAGIALDSGTPLAAGATKSLYAVLGTSLMF